MQYDVLILGGGPAGYYCALQCAQYGLRVALVEKGELGGTGFRWGCLPVKRMGDDLKRLEICKKELSADISRQAYADVLKRCGKEMPSIEEKIRGSLENKAVDIHYGDGYFEDDHTFVVGDKVLKGDRIVIATGTDPCGTAAMDVDGEVVITHKEAVDLKRIPKSMVIVGGNVEGCEFASVFSMAGIEVTIIERDEELLPGNDRDLVQPLVDRLRKHGVKFCLGVGVGEIRRESRGAVVVLEDGTDLEAEKVLMTVKRRPNFPKGIEKIGIQRNGERILVNQSLQTNIPHIYAIGDINGILGMAHVAIQQGILVADHMVRQKEITMNYKNLPRATFTIPEIAGAGYQEHELKDRDIPYSVGHCCLGDTWRGFSKRIQEGFIKILVGEDERILGIWMVGTDVSELVGILGNVMDKGVSTEDIKRSLLVHPSLSEGILEGLLNIKA